MVGMFQRTRVKFLIFSLIFLAVPSNVKPMENVLIEELDMDQEFRPSSIFLDRKKLGGEKCKKIYWPCGRKN